LTGLVETGDRSLSQSSIFLFYGCSGIENPNILKPTVGSLSKAVSSIAIQPAEQSCTSSQTQSGLSMRPSLPPWRRLLKERTRTG
jgi:hypothetical protein